MAKAKVETSFWGSMLQARLFKKSQGRIVRQVTFFAVASIFLIAAWRLNSLILLDYASGIRWGVPAAVTALGVWFAYGLVNWPPFANFLISVEAEMDKVSWATWAYLKRATVVVLTTMFVLGAYLFICDIIWQQVFTFVGFLKS
ncbi:MAG TPA: preprotein translocase subunit SecE [Planctomicrobium sp.]|nr:preprotein translocase subunit SecE [Planctomicrobium sp.]